VGIRGSVLCGAMWLGPTTGVFYSELSK
jgi:hypothetical protein